MGQLLDALDAVSYSIVVDAHFFCQTLEITAALEVKRKGMYQLGIAVVVVIHQHLERFIVENDELRAEIFVGKEAINAELFKVVNTGIINVPAGSRAAGFIKALPQAGGISIAAADADRRHGENPLRL